MTPLFFGSAMTNFGGAILNAAITPLKPGPHHAWYGNSTSLSRFFRVCHQELQANMDPKHRDRVAFERFAQASLKKDAAGESCPYWEKKA